MAELNENQVALISAYIKQHGIAQDELHDDLLDHVCTSIERMMEEDKTFEEAFEHTIKLFGPGGLKQVQQQTFELLTEMNETMKRVTFSFGLTSTFLLLAGTIFKLLHWPGAGVMIVLGAGLLALGYLPMVLYHKLKESPSNERVVHVAGYIGLSLATVGALFKIMHWPGAGVMLIGGLAFLGFIYIPIYYYKKYQTSVNKPITLTTSLVALTCLLVVFAMVNINSSSRFDWSMTLVNESLAESNARATESTALYDRLGETERSKTLQASVQEAYDYIDELKYFLVAETEGISLDQARGIDAKDLSSRYNYDVPTHFLFSEDESTDYHISHLVKTLDHFETDVLGLYDEDIRADIKERFPIKTQQNYEYGGVEAGWGKYHFYKVPVLSVVTQLSKLQADIRSVETQTLLYLMSQPAVSDPPSGG